LEEFVAMAFTADGVELEQGINGHKSHSRIGMIQTLVGASMGLGDVVSGKFRKLSRLRWIE
jgi:hypothetical protein